MVAFSRENLADLWHTRSQVTRSDIFGAQDDALRPVLPQSQADVSVPGMVGPAYKPGGLAIVSINPAGGTDTFEPTKGDEALYDAAKAIAQTSEVAVFEAMNDAYIAGMPSWGAQWRHIRDIVEAAGSDLRRLAYPYLVPFRTRGDHGSRLQPQIASLAYGLGFRDALAALKPGLIVTVDRPSEAAVAKFQTDEGPDFKSIYYTRQRNAHDARKKTLGEIKELASEMDL